MIRLSYTSLLNMSPNLHIYTFYFWFKLSPLSQNSGYVPTNRLRLLNVPFTISWSHKKLIFPRFLVTSLHVICGWPPPNQKSWLRLCHINWSEVKFFKVEHNYSKRLFTVSSYINEKSQVLNRNNGLAIHAFYKKLLNSQF